MNSKGRRTCRICQASLSRDFAKSIQIFSLSKIRTMLLKGTYIATNVIHIKLAVFI